MNQTEIKTRHGLIMQGVFAEALNRSGYSYAKDTQYDPASEKPDFLIPNELDPKYLIEVHQTEARNSFQMKTLRAFTAVAEGKAYYTNNMVTVNVLFGDPDNELPAANVKAMCSFFDENILPRKDANNPQEILLIEKASLIAASTSGMSVKDGIKDVITKHSELIYNLVHLIKSTLGSAKATKAFFPLWDTERERIYALKNAPSIGNHTYYKRMLLKSLFLKDEDFVELQQALGDPGICSPSVQDQVLITDIAELKEELDGDYYELDPEFKKFLYDPESQQLRSFCKTRLEVVPEIKWFFEDIIDGERRNKIANEVINIINSGEKEIVLRLIDTLSGNNVCNIEHRRSWLADGLALISKKSQNSFNNRLVQTNRDPENYQNPYNAISGKFERLINSVDHISKYARYSVEVFYEFINEEGIEINPVSISPGELSELLLKLRLDGVIKLQRFNPLYEIIISTCNSLNLIIKPIKVKSLIYDLTGGKGRLGKYDAYEIVKNNEKLLTVSIAAHDNHGDDKSKEWGARRLASLYRYDNNCLKKSEYQNALFVLDGEWKQKDIERLHRSGWDHICRLGELEDKLKSIFSI